MENRGVVLTIVLVVASAIILSQFDDTTGYAARSRSIVNRQPSFFAGESSVTNPPPNPPQKQDCECYLGNVKTKFSKYTCPDGTVVRQKCTFHCASDSECYGVNVDDAKGSGYYYTGMWKEKKCEADCPVSEHIPKDNTKK